MMTLIIIALRLIELTGPAGQTIIINPEQIVAMREPRSVRKSSVSLRQRTVDSLAWFRTARAKRAIAMTTPNRKVIDISHHNDVNDWGAVYAAGIRGVIHKATESTGYTDPTYLARCAPAMRAGLLWGAYHFASGGNVQAQVDNFLSVVGVDNDTLYALDWEDNPSGPTMTAAEAKEFIQLLEAQIGEGRCVIYSGNTAKEKISGRDPFFGARRLWLAQYGTSPTCQSSWSDFWLWQYSDGSVGPGPHGCPGVTGDVDTNSYDDSDDQLFSEWTGAVPEPAPTPDVATVDIQISVSGNAIVKVNGQTIGVV